MVQFIHLNTSKRIIGDTSSDCIINLPFYISKIKRVSLRTVLLPNTIYLISSGVNDKIPFNDGAGNKTATLSPGAYGITELLSEIQAQMNNVSSGFNLPTYSNVTKKITITRTSAFSLLWGSGIQTSCSRELGFEKIDTGSSTSHTGQNAIALYNPLSLFLSIKQLGYQGINSSGLAYTFHIPVNVDSDGVVFVDNWSWHEQSVVFPTLQSLKQFDVKLTYEDGRKVDLNGADFEILLQVESD